MLFALDIDGTIGQDTNHIARILTREFQLPISESTLDRIDLLGAFLHSNTVQSYLKHSAPELREQFCKALKAANKHPDVQRNRVPIPGAVATLQELAQQGGRIIYTACRPPPYQKISSFFRLLIDIWFLLITKEI